MNFFIQHADLNFSWKYISYRNTCKKTRDRMFGNTVHHTRAICHISKMCIARRLGYKRVNISFESTLLFKNRQHFIMAYMHSKVGGLDGRLNYYKLRFG